MSFLTDALVYSGIKTIHTTDFHQYLHVAFFIVDERLDSTFDKICQLDLACYHFAWRHVPCVDERLVETV